MKTQTVVMIGAGLVAATGLGAAGLYFYRRGSSGDVIPRAPAAAGGVVVGPTTFNPNPGGVPTPTTGAVGGAMAAKIAANPFAAAAGPQDPKWSSGPSSETVNSAVNAGKTVLNFLGA